MNDTIDENLIILINRKLELNQININVILQLTFKYQFIHYHPASETSLEPKQG
jgi:hypothetical protein